MLAVIQKVLRTRWRWLGVAIAVSWLAIACQSLPLNSASSQPRVIVRTAYGALGELFQTEVVNLGLEALGYQVVDGLEIEYDVLHEAVARGYLEFTTSHWQNLHTPYFEEFRSRLERVGTLLNDAQQGYLVDAATAQADGIQNLEQLQDPQVAQLFDVDGNGKADLIGCDQGWGCHAIIEHHLDAYGLRDTVEHRFGEYDDLIKDVVMNRVQQGQPVLYYTWTPYWVSGSLKPGVNVQWLSVPYTTLPGTAEVDASATTVNGQNLGFVVDQIQILANHDFMQAHPDVAAFFEAVQLPVRAVSLQNQRMVEQGETSLEAIRDYAIAWVDEHPQQFDQWLQAARDAA